jgi:hypothetical protein
MYYKWEKFEKKLISKFFSFLFAYGIYMYLYMHVSYMNHICNLNFSLIYKFYQHNEVKNHYVYTLAYDKC